jgi:hypothetical protein
MFIVMASKYLQLRRSDIRCRLYVAPPELEHYCERSINIARLWRSRINEFAVPNEFASRIWKRAYPGGF